MKNMKKKELKSFKKPEQSNKKQLSLQQTQPLSNRFDQNALLKTLLSPSTKRLMQGFSTDQKKIITDQFQKMMKKLKKKLGSGPVQQEQDGSTSRLECKTQRMDFVDHSNISKETIRKDVSTERKFISAKSPKHNTKLTFNHNLEKSPKKSTRNNSSQLQIQRRSSTVTSPTKKNNLSQGMHSHRSTKPSNFKPKRKRTLQSDKNTPFFIRQNDGKKNKQEHYILFGDSFVEVDNDVMKIIEDQEQEDEVKINNESCLDYDFKKCKQQKQRDEQCFNWKYFAEHKQEKKNAKIKSKEKFPDEAIIEQWYHKQNERVLTNGLQFAEKIKSVNSVNSLSDNSSIVQRIVGVTTPKQPTHAQNLFKQFYTNTTPTHPTSNSNNSNSNSNNKSNNNNNKNSTNIDSLQPPILHCLQLSRSQSEEQIEDPSPNKISQQLQQSSHYHVSYLDSLSQRQSVITLQLKTNQQILSCLLVQGKIQKKVYQKYMDMAIQLYDREMTETNRVREILEQNENKIGQIMKWNEQGIQIREKIQTVGVQDILNKMFQGYQKIVNKQEQPQIGLAIDIDSLKKHENPEFSKSHQYQTHIQRTLNEPQNHQPIHPQPSQTKQQIQQRTAFQLGVRADPTPTSTPPQKSGFSTSVLAIYQFLKNFFSFLKNYHLRQFLAYINMPYGYSVQQRLRFMQGYDDDDELYGQQNGGGIVYGLEEVLRPAIFQEFYRNFGSRGFGQSKANTDFQKLHYRMVFDALNQGFNQFRPYFLINGCPYLWTTTEKALTYYFIRQDCYQQLLQKVQIQILKWSSSLCGLLLQPSQPKQANLSSPKTLQQIFETYTINTPTELLEHRQQRILKQQKLQTEQTNFQWYFHDEFKTALLYQISSCILEDLAHECAIFATTGMEYEQVIALLGDTELNLNFK